MSSRKNLQARLDKCNQERRKLGAQLSDVGFVWHGSVHRSLLTCGKLGCRCHTDPSARHGPYAYWTTKVAGKTVSRLLTPLEADLYMEWIENRRRIGRVVQALKKLSVKAARLILKLRSLADASQQRQSR
jgi:hypothetical protein